jgi:hypothetical protein
MNREEAIQKADQMLASGTYGKTNAAPDPTKPGAWIVQFTHIVTLEEGEIH